MAGKKLPGRKKLVAKGSKHGQFGRRLVEGGGVFGVDEAKSIVITGASSGIGAALTKALADDGHRLFICARRGERLAEVARAAPSISYAVCNIVSECEVVDFFKLAGDRLGSIDVLIHCAGVMDPIGPALETNSEEWFDTLKTNLFGAFLATKHVVPLMEPARRPRILLLAGGGAFDPMPHLSAYGVAKAGIVRLVETLAIELAPRNIAINALAPGFVATEIFKSMLDAGPERGGYIYAMVVKLLADWGDNDIAVPIDCARFLLSAASAELTGKTISARHDPWDEPEFVECIHEIEKSGLFATQRMGITELKDRELAERLGHALEKHKRRHSNARAVAKLR
jgi:ketoreductase